ncbi:hypothetical protein I3400192H8_20140 [Dialister sp. i34-0019-2H8]
MTSDWRRQTVRRQTADFPYRHFERKREIFVIRGQTVNVLKVQNGKPAICRPSGIAPYIFAAKPPP